MFEVSVIICSHNPREDFLYKVIDALINQTLIKDLWELLIIDNASSKPLAFHVNEHPYFRIIREEKVGLIFARLTGIRESTGKLVIFVDDDNVLDKNYIEQALKLSTLYPNLGCIGAGKIEPDFEEQISVELIPHQRMLALRSVDKDVWSNIMQDTIIPWGAGLIVRREVANNYCTEVQNSNVLQILGRNSNNLLSGEDIEFSWVACRMGYGKGLFVSLVVTHLIDRRRVQLNHLIKLAKGHSFSYFILEYIHDEYSMNNSYLPGINEIIKQVIEFNFYKLIGYLYKISIFYTKPKADRLIIKAKQQGLEEAYKFINSLDCNEAKKTSPESNK